MSFSNVSFFRNNPVNMTMASPIDCSRVYPGGYVGQTLNGKPHGFGQMVELCVNEQRVYTGEWRNGKRHGYGCERFSGAFYEGYWKHDRKEGWGKHTNLKGVIFVSDKRQGRSEGNTLLIYPNGLMRLMYETNGLFLIPVVRDLRGTPHACAGNMFIKEAWDSTQISLPIPERPSVLLIQSLYDRNGAYEAWRQEIAAIVSVFSQSQIHDIAHPQTAREFSSLMAADVIVVRSHGDGRGVLLSAAESLGPGQVQCLSAIAKTNALVVFEGCRLGLSGGVADALSRDRPDLYVVAAPQDASYAAFVRKSEALQVRLYGMGAERIDRIYHGGKILQSHPLISPRPLL